MNFQDISDFLELVKNPAKADALLANIKKQKEQLDVSIETVGKASEIEKLRRQAERALASAQEKATAILDAAQATAVKQQQVYDDQQVAQRQREEVANTTLQEATTKLEAAKGIESTFANREKSLRSREAAYAQESVKLSALIAEYEEKLAKLRSVMS